MRGNALLACCFAAFLCTSAARPAPAQQEVYHPGETYDSLQAGQDAYWDAEAQRRALIGRQIDDRGAGHAAKHLGRPAGQISAGASRVLRPDLAQGLRRSHAGRRLCLPDRPAARVLWRHAPVPAPRGLQRRPQHRNILRPWYRSFSLGRGCPAIFGGRRTTATCGSRLATSRSGPAGSATSTNRSTPHRRWNPQPAAAAPVQRRRPLEPEFPAARVPQPPEAFKSPPPPPEPAVPPPARMNPPPGDDPAPNPPVPGPARAGQEI